MSKNNYYIIPTAIDKQVCECIKTQVQNTTELEKSTVGNKEPRFSSIRNCQVGWLYTDSWIAGMMAHFIHCANNSDFNFDLTSWTGLIQYTKYDGIGTKYNWHVDTSVSRVSPNEERKLSISVMLSEKEDYDGGNFEFLIDDERNIINLNVGDALIFPSYLKHRVAPIRSGCRETLVGWFGGPYFK